MRECVFALAIESRRPALLPATPVLGQSASLSLLKTLTNPVVAG